MPLYLAAYDITSQKRLKKIHDELTGLGIPIQKSVFILNLHGMEVLMVKAKLNALINAKEDDVRIIPISDKVLNLYGNPVALSALSDRPAFFITDD